MTSSQLLLFPRLKPVLIISGNAEILKDIFLKNKFKKNIDLKHWNLNLAHDLALFRASSCSIADVYFVVLKTLLRKSKL